MNVKDELQKLNNDKNELIKKISHLNEILLDAKDPKNSKKIAALEEEKSNLNAQLQTVIEKKNSLSAEIAQIIKQISEISSDKLIKDLFDHFKNTRFYFFENKEMLIFDKWTGMLWGNVKNFPPPPSSSRADADKLIKKIKWHNLDGWRLPEVEELPKKNEVLPRLQYKNSEDEVLEHNFLHAFGRGSCYFLSKEGRCDCDYNPFRISSSSSATFNPCNPKFKTDKFKPADEDAFICKEVEAKKVTDLIEFFIEQNWIPEFENEELEKAYKAYVEKPVLLKKLTAVDKKIEAVNKKLNKKTITADFNYRLPLMNYNLEEINHSALQFYRSSVKWINFLIRGLDDFGNENLDFFKSIEQIQLDLADDYKPIDDLYDSENQFFGNIYKRFQRIFDFDFDIVKQKLYDFKVEAEEQLQVLDNVGLNRDKLITLANIEKQIRPDFHFFAEYTGEIVQEKLKKFLWFQDKNEQIKRILAEIDAWFEDYQVFADKSKDDYFKNCKTENIDKELYESWFHEWRDQRFQIISKTMSLIANSLMPNILDEDTVLDIIICSTQFREALDLFYENERINIYRKFAFQQGGELQDKFEKESELANITYHFTEKLQKIMFESSSEKRIFILKWANTWFDSQIEQILLIADNLDTPEMNPVFLKAVNQLKLLKKRNMEVFLNDIKTFSKMAKKRNDEYNSLMFQMRKELMKK